METYGKKMQMNWTCLLVCSTEHCSVCISNSQSLYRSLPCAQLSKVKISLKFICNISLSAMLSLTQTPQQAIASGFKSELLLLLLPLLNISQYTCAEMSKQHSVQTLMSMFYGNLFLPYNHQLCFLSQKWIWNGTSPKSCTPVVSKLYSTRTHLLKQHSIGTHRGLPDFIKTEI